MSTNKAAVGPRDADHLRWLAQSGFESVNGASIIDLGCGGGYLCNDLGQRGARFVVGADIEPFDDRNADAKWKFVQINLDDLDWETKIPRAKAGEGFDLICGFDVLEHLQSPARFLRSCRELLTKNGALILTTPNTSSWERLVRGDKWSGATDPQHRVLFNRYSLKFLLEREGFSVQSIRAPIRSLEKRHIPHPAIGAQMIAVARKK